MYAYWVEVFGRLGAFSTTSITVDYYKSLLESVNLSSDEQVYPLVLFILITTCLSLSHESMIISLGFQVWPGLLYAVGRYPLPGQVRRTGFYILATKRALRGNSSLRSNCYG